MRAPFSIQAPMTSPRLFMILMALGACQHTVEAQAAEPKTTPSAPPPVTGDAPPPQAPSGLPDKAAKEAASKAIVALPACSLKPTGGLVSGQLRITPDKCTRLQCIRTCCNTCSYVAVVAGNGPQRGLDAARVRQLFPSFPEAPLECEIAAWNAQLKSVTLAVSLPEEKGAESARGPVNVCLQAAER